MWSLLANALEIIKWSITNQISRKESVHRGRALFQSKTLLVEKSVIVELGEFWPSLKSK